MKCAECIEKNCLEKGNECVENREDYIKRYNNKDNYNSSDRKMLEISYDIAAESKGKLNRIEEIILFAKKMNYKKLGLAFCKGLAKEAKKINDILKQEKDFEVESVCCKTGEIDKSEINVKKLTQEKKEVACNPLAQAEILNKANVNMVIMVGFCLGHDMLFLKNINAPTTVLLIKDKKLKHKTIDALN